MRWSSQRANGWVPAEPMASPRSSAESRTCRRRLVSCSAASASVAQGSVEISRTDSISSGLMSPFGASWSMDSIALTRSKDWPSQIMSSSSMPIV